MEATPLHTTFYKEQKQQMKIRIVGHNMKYEAECITMLFFPDEKIVTTEYPADTAVSYTHLTLPTNSLV